jgi:hypothetical protein
MILRTEPTTNNRALGRMSLLKVVLPMFFYLLAVLLRTLRLCRKELARKMCLIC